MLAPNSNGSNTLVGCATGKKAGFGRINRSANVSVCVDFDVDVDDDIRLEEDARVGSFSVFWGTIGN